jgi:predicted P-loop ATPase
MLNGELSDRTVTMLRDQIRSECGFYPDKDAVREAITAECLRNRANPVVEYFNGLKWDGTERLPKLMHSYLGAEETPLNAAISVKLMCAIVRRSRQPGCKYDHQVVLKSGQGVRKSMFCEDLAVFPDLFTDAGDLSADIKQQMEVGQGKQIIEFPEHAGHSRAMRDRNKANLTRKTDRARMAYAHYATDTPRQWVPIATVNPGGYLNDPTGERRYWHVAVSKYDREAFLADKDQLFAEAVVREPNERLWLDTPELVKAHDAIVGTAKEPNTLVDDLADLVGEVWETARDKIADGWVIHREERISNKDVRCKLGILGIEALRMRDIGSRMSDAMMQLGWTKVAGTLVCKRGSAPEGGYRRSIPDSIELDEQQPGSVPPNIRQKGHSRV